MEPLSKSRSFARAFLCFSMYVIAELVAAIPGYLLVFSVLPRFIRCAEPWGYEDSFHYICTFVGSDNDID